MTQPEGPRPAEGSNAADLLDQLERWEQFGAVWHIASRTASGVTIAFCRCDGGEEVDRLTSDDPHLLTWLEVRGASEQAAGSIPPVKGHPRS